jgi:hypothetical protein
MNANTMSLRKVARISHESQKERRGSSVARTILTVTSAVSICWELLKISNLPADDYLSVTFD